MTYYSDNLGPTLYLTLKPYTRNFSRYLFLHIKVYNFQSTFKNWPPNVRVFEFTKLIQV